MDPLTLDELDRRLVHALQIDGRAAFSHIATVLGTSDRTIARRYRRLRSAGALRVVGLPHGRLLGHVDWLVRLRCTPDAATSVAAALAPRQDTSWVSLISGGTEITCITRTSGAAKDGDLLLQKLPRTPRITAVTAHCLLRAVAGTTGWPGRTAALSPHQIDDLRPASTPCPRTDHPVELTDADHRLLAELAKDGRAGYPDLAGATGWSETTVRRRLDQLRRANILYFDVEIDPLLFDQTTEAMLWLTIAPAALATVTHALSTHPEIGFAAATTGPANVVAFVVCRDADAAAAASAMTFHPPSEGRRPRVSRARTAATCCGVGGGPSGVTRSMNSNSSSRLHPHRHTQLGPGPVQPSPQRSSIRRPPPRGSTRRTRPAAPRPARLLRARPAPWPAARPPPRRSADRPTDEAGPCSRSRLPFIGERSRGRAPGGVRSR